MSRTLAIYVHLPWCVRKCPYCDFNSHAAPARLPEAPYLEALQEDLRADLLRAGNRIVTSVFFGGGTPSLFSPSAIRGFLERLRAACTLAPDAEVTLEANPGTIERGRFDGYAAAGVNRVSLGAQTFSTAGLAKLGRIHSPSDIERAVQELRGAGIENFNLDLMYGLPGQSIGQAVDDVRRATGLGPGHVSHYQLNLEAGTPFFRHPPPGLPDDEEALEMQLACQEALEAAGLDRYEVSAYARGGTRCRHNLTYWTFGDYLGLGAGAHGKLTAEGGIARSERPRRPRAYLATGGGPANWRAVPLRDLPFEYALNALRLTDGFELQEFEAATGLPAACLRKTLAALRRRGLLEVDSRRVRATQTGLRFLSDVQLAFLPEPVDGPECAA